MSDNLFRNPTPADFQGQLAAPAQPYTETPAPAAAVPPPGFVPSAPQPEPAPPIYVGAVRPKPLFRLDDLENERTTEPFYFEFHGQVFELFDPKDLRWQDVLVAQDNPTLLIHLLMPETQRDDFMKLDLSLRKLEALFGRWQAHFGLGTPGEAAGSARS